MEKVLKGFIEKDKSGFIGLWFFLRNSLAEDVCNETEWVGFVSVVQPKTLGCQLTGFHVFETLINPSHPRILHDFFFQKRIFHYFIISK